MRAVDVAADEQPQQVLLRRVATPVVHRHVAAVQVVRVPSLTEHLPLKHVTSIAGVVVRQHEDDVVVVQAHLLDRAINGECIGGVAVVVPEDGGGGYDGPV
jgi:hypothetical protein